MVGVGNLLLMDDGIGVHVAQALQQMDIDANRDLQILDGGTSPDVIFTLDQVDKLIIVDAAEGHCDPGTIYRFRPEELPHETADVHSLHEVSFSLTLRIMNRLGISPKDVVVFGVQPKEIDWGLQPSDVLTEKIPEIVGLVLEETKKC